MMNTMGEAATLTDKLALMPDQMLPRLAQQYKNDAITLSLILNEKTRRERLRNAATTRMAENQPKVNDQIVAGMQPQLPEQVGIGALPAQNMQQMADGGIAGYDMNPDNDGQLQYNNEPVLRMAGGGVARYDDGGLLGNLLYSNITPVERARRERLAAEAEAKRQTPRPSTYEEERQRNMQQVANQGYTRTDPRALPSVPSPAVQLAQAALPPVPDGQGGLGDLAPPPAAPRASTPAVPAVTGPDVGKLKEQYLADVGGMAPKPESATDFLARRKEMLGDEGQAMSKYEAKLLAQEAAAPREKDEAFWMAVTQAGLAAAAGASPYALKNIAEGFGTGLAGYRESLKEFKKAESERDKAMAAIESARRAEKRGDVDAAVAFEAKSQERLDRHNDRVAAGLASLTGSQISGEYSLAGHKISGEYSLAGHQVSAAASREGAQAYRQAALEQRNIGLVENIRKNIEAKLANQFLADPAGLAAETERRLQIELQRYPGLAQYAGTPSGATKFSPADQALVNKYATPPR